MSAAHFAPRALPRFSTTTGQSAPLRRIGTFSLAVGAACAFSLGIAGQVLTFRTGARLSFAPPPCRMPLGQSQDIPQADPGGMATPRFWHRLIISHCLNASHRNGDVLDAFDLHRASSSDLARFDAGFRRATIAPHSMIRLAAGASGFLTLTQSGDRPER